MSFKSRFGFLFRKFEFDAVRDRRALPLLWAFGVLGLAMGVYFLVAGLHEGFDRLTSAGLLQLICAMSIFRVAIGARRKIKEFDARNV